MDADRPLVPRERSIVSRTADRFADLCDRIDKIAVYLSAAELVAMALILVTEVFLRLFVSRSTLIADEIASYMLAFISFMALGHTLRTGNHLRVELITNHLSAAARKVVEIISILIAIVSVCFLTAWLFRLSCKATTTRSIRNRNLRRPCGFLSRCFVSALRCSILALISRLIRVSEKRGGTMSAYQTAFILLIMLFFFLGAGLWIALALGIAGVVGLYVFTPYPVAEIVALQTWNRSTIYVLTAIPLFVLCAELLITTRLAKWLFDGLAPWLIWLPGRLMHTCVVGCAFMAGITGQAPLTA